jgi:hypothetical protein
MCLIAIGKCADILAADVKEMWSSNSDGAGVAAHKDGKPYPIKGIMKLQQLMRVLKTIPADQMIAVHFRWATHGAVTPGNTHPFRVDNDTLLMHNGVLSEFGQAGKNGESDSKHLARVLGQVDVKDRAAVLKSLSGKYCLITPTNFHMYGHFTKQKEVHYSNMFWERRHYNTTSYKTTVSAAVRPAVQVPLAAPGEAGHYAGMADVCYDPAAYDKAQFPYGAYSKLMARWIERSTIDSWIEFEKTHPPTNQRRRGPRGVVNGNGVAPVRPVVARAMGILRQRTGCLIGAAQGEVIDANADGAASESPSVESAIDQGIPTESGYVLGLGDD